ncbi:WD40 repeat domain-containing protein [Kutzneria sp. 744]|uniref:WD40 repeat domain-containing protein n=1 Tax=Kutzneria sp. (strain 744) TaxID=345341 RepID=UPI0004B21015|nr:WD40 repeat domain-containing protein [Kutzneria sp. 744]
MATAVTHHVHQASWDRPALAKARQDVVDLFTGRFGYRHLTDLGLDPTRQQLDVGLRRVCARNAMDPINELDMLAVYITCHGHVLDDTGDHVLITSDTHPDDLGYALSTVDITTTLLRGTRVRRLLLMLDTCQSGRGGNEIAAKAVARLTDTWEPGSGIVVIASAQPTEEAMTGVFPQLLRDAVEAMSTAGHGPETLDAQVLVGEMNKQPGRPGYQRVGIAQFGMTGQAPPFLPNPRHDPALNGVDVAIQRASEWRAQADEQEVAFRDNVVRRAMGSHDAPGGGWWFTGRHRALLDLTAWLARPDRAHPLRVVTGDPGSGKSAVLGLLATLAHAERRRTVPIDTLGLPAAAVPEPGVIDTRLTAQQLTTEQILHAVAAAACVDASTLGELLARLGTWVRERGCPFTVLLDGVDEAAAPSDLVAGLLAPLVEHAKGRVRLLLGARPHMLPALARALPTLAPDLDRGSESLVVDLDSARYADFDAMTEYTIRNLLGATVDSPYKDVPRHRLRPVAVAVAEAAHPSFLVARITATTLTAQPVVTDAHDPAWRQSLPSMPGQAMRHDLEIRLRGDTKRARDLLLPLAFAQGQGLPWEDIWAPLASCISGLRYTDEDLLWLRNHAGSYIVENVDQGRSAYRLYHQALVEHLRADADPHRVHDAFVTVLLDRVPLDVNARTDWTRAHPYTRTYLATHAAGAGRVDEIISDPEYLVHADPDTLLAALHLTTTDTARRTRAIYRNTHHRALTPTQRRHTLAIDATRFGDTSLATELAHNLIWRPQWATGKQTSVALRTILAGHTNLVQAVACTELQGRPIAVTSSTDGSVLVWDLTEGTLRTTLPSHTNFVRAVACAEIDGRPIILTSTRNTVWVWDLTDGTLRTTLTGHTSVVQAVTCAKVDGRPIAVTSSGDGSVLVWDLTDGAPRTTLTGHTGTVRAVTCTELDGRPVAITGSDDGILRVWDLTEGTLRTTLPSHTKLVRAVACAEIDGRPIVLTTARGTVRVWDLTDGTLRSTLTGHTNWVQAVACTELQGRPIAVTGSDDSTVRVWDLTDGTLRTTLTGHTGKVQAVACANVDGRPIAVTGSDDSTVRVWELLAVETTTTHDASNTDILGMACTELQGRPIVVTGCADRTVRVWDLTDGTLRTTLTGHNSKVRAVACTELQGRPIAVTGSDDSTVRVWDLTDGTLRTTLTGHTNWVQAVACTELQDRPIAVTGSDDSTVRVWDLTDGTLRTTLTGHTGKVQAVACANVDGRPIAVTGSNDCTVRMWDLTDGTLRTNITIHTGLARSAVRAVACTELDGRPVAITGSDDGILRVWDLSDGTLRTSVTSHAGKVEALECAEVDGRPIAVTGSDDRTVRVWDLDTGALDTLFQQNRIRAVAVGPNGEILTSMGWDLVVNHKVGKTFDN